MINNLPDFRILLGFLWISLARRSQSALYRPNGAYRISIARANSSSKRLRLSASAKKSDSLFVRCLVACKVSGFISRVPFNAFHVNRMNACVDLANYGARSARRNLHLGASLVGLC